MNTICKEPNNMKNKEGIKKFKDNYCVNGEWQSIPDDKINDYKCGKKP